MGRLATAGVSSIFVVTVAACGSGQSTTLLPTAQRVQSTADRSTAIVVPSKANLLTGRISRVERHEFGLDSLGRNVEIRLSSETVLSGGPLRVGKYAQVVAIDRYAAYVALWSAPAPRVVVTGTIVATTRLGFKLRTESNKRISVILTSATKESNPTAIEVTVSGRGSRSRGIVAFNLSSQASPASRLSVPVFHSTFTYGGRSYPYTIVGSNPNTAPTSNTINVAIVPLRLVFANGGAALDATSAAASIALSPLFTSASYPGIAAVGSTQYGDALMRSEFWSYIDHRSSTYHVLLAKPTVEPTYTLSVPTPLPSPSPSNYGGYAVTGNGQTEGYMNFAWFIQTEEKQIVDRLAIPPSTLTIFATVNAKVLEPYVVRGSYYCCYAGYHYDFPARRKTWTTAWASVTSTSIDALSHEIAEWLNDPFYNNYVPNWVSPESGQCGGNELEVGDPVTNYTFTVNGFTVQDESFYSWFSRQTPSAGINGWYDMEGVLKQPASNC